MSTTPEERDYLRHEAPDYLRAVVERLLAERDALAAEVSRLKLFLADCPKCDVLAAEVERLRAALTERCRCASCDALLETP
jgi:anti-sigma factor RsiW